MLRPKLQIVEIVMVVVLQTRRSWEAVTNDNSSHTPAMTGPSFQMCLQRHIEERGLIIHGHSCGGRFTCRYPQCKCQVTICEDICENQTTILHDPFNGLSTRHAMKLSENCAGTRRKSNQKV